MAEYPDTFGWDTVFAISIDKVNPVLARRAPSPAYNSSAPISGGGTATLDWSLTDWRITDTPGGADIAITMQFGPGSTLSISGGAREGTYDLTLPGYACNVTFEAWFDAGRLVPRTDQNQAWATVDVDVPPTIPFDVDIALSTLLASWFQTSAAVQLFEQEFVNFDMSGSVGKNDLPWLIPKQPLGNAGGVMADGVTKAIGILAMTLPRSTTVAGELKLSPYAIPANASAGFLISREVVMTQMILPAVAGAFSLDGVGNAGDYDVSETWEISNKTGLTFQHELKDVERTSTIDSGNLRIWQEADRLGMTITPLTMETELAGLFIDAKIDERMEMTLVAKQGAPDSKVFLLNNVDPRAPVVSHHMSDDAVIGAAVVGGIVAAAGIALGVVSFKGTLMARAGLSSQAAKILARVIAAIVAGVGLLLAFVSQVISSIRNGTVEDIPDIGPLLSTSLSRLQWPGATKTQYVATAGQFANGVLLTIDPQIS
ncbi:MAG: TULIP family P47-like protein [Pseudomonadota bacterium]